MSGREWQACGERGDCWENGVVGGGEGMTGREWFPGRMGVAGQHGEEQCGW